MIETYAMVKWLHVTGAAVILGTGLGTAFHFWITMRREGPAEIAAAGRSTVLADWIFTLPAVILQPLTGIALAAQSARAGTALAPEFHRLARFWVALGWPAFIAMAATVWLMVARPA